MLSVYLMCFLLLNNASSRTPSKLNITSKNELTRLRAKGNYHPQTPSKPKGSLKKQFEGDAESDSDNDIVFDSNSKASGKDAIKSKSFFNTNSDDEALMSPFKHINPRRSTKSIRWFILVLTIIMILIFMIVICIIRDEEDDNNYAYEAETYLENQTTRYYLLILPIVYIYVYMSAANPLLLWTKQTSATEMLSWLKHIEV
jgi:hypothetical protein